MHITVACILITVFGVNVRLYVSYLYINIGSPGQSYLGHRKLFAVIKMFCLLTLSVCAAETCLRCGMKLLVQTLHLLARSWIVLWWTNSPPLPAGYVHTSLMFMVLPPSLVPCLDWGSWFWPLLLVCWTPPLENPGTASFYLNTRHKTNTE